MQIIHHLQIDLARRLPVPPLGAVQNDANTRCVAIDLLENGSPWAVPAGVTGAVAFCKQDGHRGLYDQLPDGAKAVTIDGSTVTAILAPQVLTCAGVVQATVIFYDGDVNTLAAFPFMIRVEKNPAAGESLSNDYYALQNLDQVNAAYNELLKRIEALEQNGIGQSGDYLPLTGGTLKTDKAEVLRVESTSGASSYMSFRAEGGYRATQGYHNGMAYIANERAGGARIGVNDQKEPEFRSSTRADTAQTLLHTGNAEEKLGLTYTDSPLPFAEIQCNQPCNTSMWVTEYAYKKGYVQHIKTRVMEGWTGVNVCVGIVKAHDQTLLRKYTTTADAGEVIIPVEEYIGCDFYVALAGEGLDFKSFKYGTYPMRFFSGTANTYLRNLNEGDIITKTFADQMPEVTDNTGSYVLAQEVTYNGRYNASKSHTYTRNKMFAAGDSITAGYPSYTEGIHWWETVGRTLGYEVTRGAQNGNGFAYLTSPTSNNACVIAKNTDFKLYDVAVFAFGTNDYGNNITMGTIDDAPSHVTDNTGTFYAAVKYVVEKVLTSNPTCMLIFALPINRCDKGSTFETNWCFGLKNTAGHSLSDYCDAIIAVCNKYGIPYIDRRNSVVNAYTVQTLMIDKLHPTDEGYKLLGMELAARIGALIRPYAEYNGEA